MGATSTVQKRPRVLFIDEGTANLDVELEKRINEALLAMPITRIHVAHRPQTIALADRAIHLGAKAEHELPPDSAPASAALVDNVRLLKRDG